MYKINLENDLKKLDDVISFKNRNKYYGRIYFKSNEYVNDILSNFDIKSSKIKLHKKYDIVYLSNIPDWFFDFDFYNELVLFRYSNNISKLLKRSGIAIRSYVDSLSGSVIDEIQILGNCFNYDRIDSEKKLNIGHYYAKK